MTVRAWFIISAFVLVALGIAVGIRLTRPAPVPEIAARADRVRLDGERTAWCWPRRGNEVWCATSRRGGIRRTIPPAGRMRLFVFPVPPNQGIVLIKTEGGEVVERHRWTPSFRYDLDVGSYVLEAEARYGQPLYVRYNFPFRVTRSGS